MNPGMGVKRLTFPVSSDARGSLTFGQYPQHLPFEPKRFFVIRGVPEGSIRGGHGHRKLERVLMSVSGSCQLKVDDGRSREQFTLDAPEVGIYLPPLVWGSLLNHTEDCVLLVLASAVYDESDYLRDYDEFLALTATEEA